MRYIVVGILDSYRNAEEAVQDLELAGIVGEQVELISDIDDDTRTANTPGEPSTKPAQPGHNWFTRLFGPGGPFEKREVSDLSGDQPNFIGDQEFYANHIRHGGAVMIVRATTQPVADRASAILRDHGARTPGSKDAPTVQRIG